MVNPGDILIAKPFLQDGQFKRSVIYLTEHNDKGSLGFVVNKPQGLLLKDIFPHLKHGNFPLFEGGPVSSNQLYYTHTLGKKLSDSVDVGNGVFWGGNFFELTYFIEHKKIKPNEIRFYVGYTGWEPGQLNQEILNDSWFTKSENYLKLMRLKPEEVWGYELCKIKPHFRVFSDYENDPSPN